MWHLWRECVRDQVWHMLTIRRPVFDGIALVNRKLTLRLQQRLQARERGVLQCVLADGLLTRSRLSHHLEERQCPQCHTEETPFHVYWECPRWAMWRRVPLCQVLHLPPATRNCGLLLQRQGRDAVQVQEQLFQIAWQYIQSRPVPLRQPRPAPLHLRQHVPEPPPELRVPIFRLTKKCAPGTFPSLPAKPFHGIWVEKGHHGKVIRHKRMWKIFCERCSRCSKWERRHRMPMCQDAMRGQRIAVPEGYTKYVEQDVVRLRCNDCKVSSLWASQARFVRHHRCKLDVNGDVVVHVPPDEQQTREEALGFTRHAIVPEGDKWTCTSCHRTLKRRQVWRRVGALFRRGPLPTCMHRRSLIAVCA